MCSRICPAVRYTRIMHTTHTFKVVPNPATSPRIQARKSYEELTREIQRYTQLLWSVNNHLGERLEDAEERLRQLERRLPTE